MPTQAIAGYLGRLYGSIDAGANYREYGEMRNFTARIKTDMIDATSHASAGDHEVIPGIRSWDADMEYLYVSSDAAQDEIDTAITNRTKTLFRFDPEGTSSGKERWSGAGYFADAEIQGPTADAAMRNVKITGTGALTKSTQ